MSSRISLLRSTVAAVALCSLVAGCATTGQNQALGSLIGGVGGAVVGGALGSAIGGEEAQMIGALIGAGVGAYFGNRIARELSERDQQAMQAQTARALSEAPDGERVAVQLPESGRTLGITASGTTYDEREMAVSRITGVAQPPAGFEVINTSHATTTALNLRSSPTVGVDNRLGTLPEGEVVNVLGRIRGSDWMILTRGDGAVIGYAAGEYLLPTWETAAATPRLIRTVAVEEPSAQRASVTDLDAEDAINLDDAVLPASVRAQAVNLDALDATTEVTQVASACRTVTYDLDDLEDGGRICRGDNGVWQLA